MINFFSYQVNNQNVVDGLILECEEDEFISDTIGRPSSFVSEHNYGTLRPTAGDARGYYKLFDCEWGIAGESFMILQPADVTGLIQWSDAEPCK